MENYFDKIINNSFVEDLMAEIYIEFSNDNNVMPSEYEFGKFILEKKKEFIDILRRLTNDEKILFLEKVKKELQGEYHGIRKLYGEMINIKPNIFFTEFPQYIGKTEFSLTPNEWGLLENRYSIYPLFKRALKELRNTIVQLEQGKTTFKPEQQTQTESEVNDFFYEIKECSITKIEIYNRVEKITDNFSIVKLKLLLDDFEFYLFMEKEEREADFSIENVIKKINEYKKNGKEIPYLKIENKDTHPQRSKLTKEFNDAKMIDKEKLFFPHDFFCCYQFRAFLRKEIEKRKSTETQKNAPVQKISHAAIALKYQWLRLSNLHSGMDEKNKDEIAAQHGWEKKTSGKQIYDEYKYFFREEDRINPKVKSRGDKTSEENQSFHKSKTNRSKDFKAAISDLEKNTSYSPALELANKELKKLEQK